MGGIQDAVKTRDLCANRAAIRKIFLWALNMARNDGLTVRLSEIYAHIEIYTPTYHEYCIYERHACTCTTIIDSFLFRKRDNGCIDILFQSPEKRYGSLLACDETVNSDRNRDSR